MSKISRRQAVTLVAATAGTALSAGVARSQSPRLSFMTAGQGSAFLPYGQGIAKVLAAAGIDQIDVHETKGSNENLSAVNASTAAIGTAFLGSAHEALNGVGFAAGARHENIRALFAMYETAFMAAALSARGISTIAALNGKRVGCGPANGPAEGYFRAVAEIAEVTAVIVGGTPADQAKQLRSGEIDAFWQGAFVPIPSLVAVANAADCVVFGLAGAEIAAMRKRFPFMADASYPAGTYRGQQATIETVAAWNVVVAHQDLPEDLAYRITRAVLTAPDLSASVGAAAASTTAANATKNSVVPYHAGARRALAELGVTVR